MSARWIFAGLVVVAVAVVVAALLITHQHHRPTCNGSIYGCGYSYGTGG